MTSTSTVAKMFAAVMCASSVAWIAAGQATQTRTSLPVSTNGQCGATAQMRCQDSYCCSQYGYCGITAEYCTGCQVGFGVCNVTQTLSQQSGSSTLTSTGSQRETSSQTRSRSSTVSVTGTRTGSLTPSLTSTRSQTLAGTGSGTGTPSNTATGTGTATQTDSRSKTQSAMPTVSMTSLSSPSQTLSRTVTCTTTSSVSQTRSQQATSSSTSTHSRSSTHSATRTSSQTETPSELQTPTRNSTVISNGSGSLTPTPSGTATGTPSKAASGSQAQSATPPAFMTRTTSSTPSQIISRVWTSTSSVTQTRSQQATYSSSSTLAHSRSPTQFVTRSQIETPSQMPSHISTGSAIGSGNGTSYDSLSETSSRTQLPSLTPTGTSSQRSSQTQSPQPTVSGSEIYVLTRTPTLTITTSETPRFSLPAVTTRTCTGTTTVTASSSPHDPSTMPTSTSSVLASIDLSPEPESASPSPSPVLGFQFSRTPSPSESVWAVTSTAQVSSTGTGTASGTSTSASTGATMTAFKLATSSASVSTPSLSKSSQPTISQRHTASGSPRPSSYESRSSTASYTSTCSLLPFLLPVLSISASPSQTAPETQSQQPTAGMSRSPTPSASASPSPAPYALVFSQLSGGGGVSSSESRSGALLLSDSLPLGGATPLLSRCPGVPAQLAVTLACTAKASGNASVLQNPPLLLATSPSEFGVLACSSADAGTVTVLTPMSVQLLPPFGTPSFVASVICNLTGSDGSAMGSATLSVDVQATLWPTFDDAIVVLSNGFSRSVTDLGPQRLNATAALLAVLAGSPASDATAAGNNVTRRALAAVPTSARASVRSQSSFDDILAAAVSDPVTVLAAMQSVWGGVRLPAAGAAARPFSLTLFDATPLVLRSRTRSFADGTEVFVGEVRCNGTIVSPNGEWLSTVAPSPDALCGSTTCAYATLLVRNQQSNSSSSLGTLRGASLACPPFCAGTVGSGVFPFTPAPNATVVPATLDGTGTLAVPIDLATASVAATGIQVAASAGLFYSEACSSAGIYTDPSSGSCTNASDPAAALCAFGGGSSCRSCPAGALCPGGFRAWPQRGYWSPTESSAKVTACIQPFAAAKCLGWSAALSASQCGPGYRQGSYLCSACAPDYFLSGDGSCAACPVSPSLWMQYAGLFTLLALVACFAFAVYILLVIVALAAGFSVRIYVRDVLTLLMHCFTIIQVLSTVAQVGSARIPPLLRALYEGVGLLQFQGITLPPACTRSYPFVTDVSLISVATGLWLAAVAAAQLRQVLGDRPWRSAVYVFATAAVYLHPTASASALRLLNCRSVQLSASAVAALEDSSGNAAPVLQPYSAAASTTTVSVVSSNPFIPCFGALHTPAGGLAIAALIAFIAAMPLLTLFWLWWDPWLAAELNSEVRKRHESTQTLPPPQPLQKEDRRRSSLIVPTALSVIISDSLQVTAPGPLLSPPLQARQLPMPPRRDTMLHPFLQDSGYTPQGWFWRHIDMCVVFGLVAIDSFLPSPETPAEVTAKLAVTLVLLMALALALAGLRNPYKKPWKRTVRLAIIALSAACACINAASRTLDLGYGGLLLAACITPGAYVILGIFCISVAVLLLGFGRDVLGQALSRARPPETVPTLEEVIADERAATEQEEEDEDGVEEEEDAGVGFAPQAPPLLAIPSLALSSRGGPSESSSVVSPNFSLMDLVTSDRDPDDTVRAAQMLAKRALSSKAHLAPPGASVRVPVGSSSWRTRGSSGLRAWGSDDGVESGRGTDRVVSVRDNALVTYNDTNRDVYSQMRLAPPRGQRPPRAPSWFADGISTSRTQSSADSSLPSSVVYLSVNLQQLHPRHQQLDRRHQQLQPHQETLYHELRTAMQRAPATDLTSTVPDPQVAEVLIPGRNGNDTGGSASSFSRTMPLMPVQQVNNSVTVGGNGASESESTFLQQPASARTLQDLGLLSACAARATGRAVVTDLPPPAPSHVSRLQCQRDISKVLVEESSDSSVAAVTQAVSREMRPLRLARAGESDYTPSLLQRAGLLARGVSRLSAQAGVALSPSQPHASGASSSRWVDLATASSAAAAPSRGRRASFSGDLRSSALAAIAQSSVGTGGVTGLQDGHGLIGRFPRRRRSSLLNSASASMTFDRPTLSPSRH